MEPKATYHSLVRWLAAKRIIQIVNTKGLLSLREYVHPKTNEQSASGEHHKFPWGINDTKDAILLTLFEFLEAFDVVVKAFHSFQFVGAGLYRNTAPIFYKRQAAHFHLGRVRTLGFSNKTNPPACATEAGGSVNYRHRVKVVLKPQARLLSEPQPLRLRSGQRACPLPLPLHNVV